MAKDMFYNSGFPNGGDGRCANCHYWTSTNGGDDIKCNETDTDVKTYVIHGSINHFCPFVTN